MLSFKQLVLELVSKHRKAEECQVTGQLPCKQKHVMKYDISLEQRHAVLGVLLEIWRCIYIISLFVPVLHGNDLEPHHHKTV